MIPVNGVVGIDYKSRIEVLTRKKGAKLEGPIAKHSVMQFVLLHSLVYAESQFDYHLGNNCQQMKFSGIAIGFISFLRDCQKENLA